MASVLALLAPGFEEIEFITPVDLLRRAGVTVTTASIGPTFHVTGRSGVTLHADGMATDVSPSAFDGLFLPGGPGVAELRRDGRAASLAREFSESGRLVAAICAAPLVLKDAGLLTGRRFTSHPSTKGELPERLGDERVVLDGRLLTSRGAGTALEFALRLVEELSGRAASETVRAAIAA